MSDITTAGPTGSVAVQAEPAGSPATFGPVTEATALRAEYARLVAERDQLVTALASLRTEQVEVGDARLSRVWEVARRYAESAGHLSEYNALANELAGPVATATYEVEIDVTLAAVVTASIDAESQEHADDQARDLSTGEISDLFDEQEPEVHVTDWSLL